MISIQIPQFDLSNKTSLSKSDFDKAYITNQIIHLRGFKATNNNFGAQHIQFLFQSLDDKDKTSWCVENKKGSYDGKVEDVTPSDFLDGKQKDHRGYCSFLVQHSTIVKENLWTRLPLIDLPIQSDDSAAEHIMKVEYGPCIWFFFGKNYKTDENTEPMPGRPEHTDSVNHDGTWHYQLAGTKIWRLKPTDELLEQIRQSHESQNKKQKLNNESISDEENPVIEIECKQGDILLLNTRLWWHSTIIPIQDDTPSISYARDIYFQSNDSSKDKECTTSTTNKQSMSNVDGTYAAQDIEADTILFTEHTMPDCELHRSKTNPNCQVVELEDGEGESYMAVVSLREIKAGEFFCIEESDDSDVEDGDCEGDSEEEGACKTCPT